MLIINANEFGSIDQALKVLKNKTIRTKLIQELRDRQTFTKPSVSRRKEVLDAVYKIKKSKLSKDQS